METAPRRTTSLDAPAQNPKIGFDEYREALPKIPYYSDDKRFYPNQFAPKEEVLDRAYLQHNFPLVTIMHFDCDKNDVMQRVWELGLLEPTWLINNRDNGHSHAAYQLADPFHPSKASKATRQTFKRVRTVYKDALCADAILFREKQLAKNAMSPKWDTERMGPITTLSEMSYSLKMIQYGMTRQEDAKVLRRPADERLAFENFLGIGRNVTLFDFARHFAYKEVVKCVSQQELHAAVLYVLQEANKTKILLYFPRPLPLCEIHATARSISKYTWHRKQFFTNLVRGDRETIKDYLISKHGGKIPKNQWCREFQVERRRRQSRGRTEAAARQGEARRASVMRQVEAGASPKQIALNEGVTVRRVFQILAEMK